MLEFQFPSCHANSFNAIYQQQGISAVLPSLIVVKRLDYQHFKVNNGSLHIPHTTGCLNNNSAHVHTWLKVHKIMFSPPTYCTFRFVALKKVTHPSLSQVQGHKKDVIPCCVCSTCIFQCSKSFCQLNLHHLNGGLPYVIVRSLMWSDQDGSVEPKVTSKQLQVLFF